MRYRTVFLATTAATTLLLVGWGAAGASPGAGSSSSTTGAPTPESSTEVPDTPQVPGMVIYASEFDVAETAERVEDALTKAGMVTAIVDHAANATAVGEELRPTTLVIGGAPMAGTPIMLADQRAAVDLPQKYLAWEAEDGTTHLGYNSAEYVAARAGIPLDSEAIVGLQMGSATVAAAASGSDQPLADGAAADVSADPYLITQQSNASVEESIARYDAAFRAMGLMPAATVDHAAGAATIGEQLRPTSVIFVGNPMVGTQLLLANQTMGIDLPVRYLAWEDAEGVVTLGYPDVNVLAERHGLTGVDEALATVEMATSAFTTTAATGA